MPKKKINSLSSQVFIHSVGTDSFYNEEEYKIHSKLLKLWSDQKIFKSMITVGKKEKVTKKKPKKKEFVAQFSIELAVTSCVLDGIQKIVKQELEKIDISIKQLRKQLVSKFPLNQGIRHLRKDAMMKEKYTIDNVKEWAVNDKTVISVFESTLTRKLGAKTAKNKKLGSENDLICTDIIIVQTYYQSILKDIVEGGFMYNGERFVFLTASAGQIRTKKNVFVRENVWIEHRDSLTCGLSIEKINAKGGLNTNKYVSYTALFASATEVWEGFDINRAICVEDMEFSVDGVVDYIDRDTFDITPHKKMQIPINHTDGCGMVLPRIQSKNMQIRLPWMKGLLVPVPFDKFAKDNHNSYWVTDIDGNARHIKNENIHYIFTRSQWKASKYFDSWKSYQEAFIKYNCEAAKCNEEENVIGGAKLSYQMLQTLNQITDEELIMISEKSVDTIRNIGSDRDTMLNVLGVTESNEEKNYYQQALEIYPELLTDTYSRKTLKDIKASLYKKALYAKLEIEGRYTFLIPDMYAFCEWLFLGHKKPKGLLNDGEVFCKLFADNQKLDVCRSPHLYREHPIKVNKIDKEKKKWFRTNGIYTSCHDLISKLIQNDWDGDKAVVISDSQFVSISERHMEGIVPLYYEMKSADPAIISEKSIYAGLKNAYGGTKIGEVSNNISKVWNSDNVNLDVIKYQCLINNFAIDYAKTLFMPKKPKHIKKMISEYTKNKVPHFFIYAKGKEKDEVSKTNNSVVNRLEKIIPKTQIRFTATNLGKFDYMVLMGNKKYTYVESDQAIIDKYDSLNLNKKFMTNEFVSDDIESSDNLYVYQNIRNQILEVNKDVKYVTDVLVRYLYENKKSNYKTTLWSSFGDVIVDNIHKNVVCKFENGFGQCKECGDRFKIEKERQINCGGCQEKIKKEKARLRKIKYNEKHGNAELV